MLKGGDNAAVLAAGLPNITGRFWDLITNAQGQMGSTEGCFITAVGTNQNNVVYFADGTYYPVGDGIILNASKSNSVYGNAETVQPLAFVQIRQIKC